MILNASAENGSVSSALRLSSFSSSSMPSTGGRSIGDGSSWITASSMACTPLFLNAVPQSTGITSTFSVRSRMPAMISASDRSPSLRYLSISSSDASAAASTMNSRAFGALVGELGRDLAVFELGALGGGVPDGSPSS